MSFSEALLMRPLMMSIVVLATGFVASAQAEPKLLAVAKIPWNNTDLSNLTEKLGDGVPHNRLGSFGSAISWTGKGNRYVLLPDRGPKDGAVTYQCRFQVADLILKDDSLTMDLKETVILRNPMGEPYTGSLLNLPRRFDPEGMRISPKGTVYVSDEYGPQVLEFDAAGKQLHAFKIPERFLVAKPNVDPAKEHKDNIKGRCPNRGFEGLALTPDGKKLVALLQSPLIQDGGFDSINARILEIDIATNATREFVYPLASKMHGNNEILAVSNDEFLVLERDSAVGTKRFCKIFRISLKHATDVSGIDKLPKSGLPSNVSAVTKSLFLDLNSIGLNLPEKVEGLTFGPDLADGRRLLLVSTDNDFTEHPTFIYAFAVPPGDLGAK